MLLLKSFILGFSVSAPIGPIGLLCMQRTIARGKAAGISTGLGAVTANTIYATIAALGFSVVSAFLLEQEVYLQLLGAAFLFYLGIKTFLKKSSAHAAGLAGETLAGMYFSTFLLMITNPVTILNFTAMFAGLGIGRSSGFPMIVGVSLGAATWWIFLSFIVSIFKNKLTPHLNLVNKIAGVLIIFLALLSFIR